MLSKTSFGPNFTIKDAKKWLKGGPRKHLYFRPEQVKAAIVTCGGLCPGLNDVIRGIVMSLNYNYGVKEVFGIKFGYRGFYTYEWMQLTVENVKDIHHLGGTILGSSRGGFSLEKIMASLEKKGITHLYCIGGDGTHYGVLELCKEIKRR